MVLAVAVAGDNTARGQFDQDNGTDLFAGRNGIGTTCLDMTDLFDLNIATNAVDSADDTEWIRLREAEARPRFDADFTANNTFTLATFVRNRGPADGAVSVEGDMTLSGATVTVAKGTALRLKTDDRVRLAEITCLVENSKRGTGLERKAKRYVSVSGRNSLNFQDAWRTCSATLTARSVPCGLPVGVCCTTDRASRVATAPSITDCEYVTYTAMRLKSDPKFRPAIGDWWFIRCLGIP